MSRLDSIEKPVSSWFFLSPRSGRAAQADFDGEEIWEKLLLLANLAKPRQKPNLRLVVSGL
jgi:hypothetical protein